jgi:hypothetical protein
MADKSLLRVSCPQFWILFEGQKVRVNTISQSPTATKAVKLLKVLMVLLHLLINGTVR